MCIFPNLEAEQARFGYTEEFVAQKLGMTTLEYREHKRSGAFRLPEALVLVEMYGKSMDYLLSVRAG
ncbi:MAG: hypothetical protein FWC23_11000 [Chitinispirillia bacterium]|nr:hypothetical protein [Chitinispirillia bacterium]MCL2269695.1 hypothetical protein [Chitinispirillia bacterium]